MAGRRPGSREEEADGELLAFDLRGLASVACPSLASTAKRVFLKGRAS